MRDSVGPSSFRSHVTWRTPVAGLFSAALEYPGADGTILLSGAFGAISATVRQALLIRTGPESEC